MIAPENLLNQIEKRTAHVLSKLREAVQMIRDAAYRPSAHLRPAPTIRDIEAQTRHWADLVPDDPALKAALIAVMRERYPLNAALLPRLSSALGVDDPAVQTAFEAATGERLPDALNAALPDDARTDPTEAALEALLDWRYLRRGETLFHQGDVADAMYFVVDGLLRMTSSATGETDTQQIEIDAGETPGALAMLTEVPHLSTFVAVRDSDLVRLSRVSYERMLEQYPGITSRFTVRLMKDLHSLRNAERGPNRHSVRSLAIIPASDGIADFVHNLVAALREDAQVQYLSPHTLADYHPPGLSKLDNLDEAADDFDFVDWLQVQQTECDLLVYLADAAYPAWTRRCVEQADRVLVVGRAGEAPELSAAEQIIARMSTPELIAPVELVLLVNSLPYPGTVRWLAPRRIERHHHVQRGQRTDIDRLVRFIRGRAVGVVFGGGGMRASAHVGAIQALHEFGIPIDWVGGTSAGAIAAAEYALGMDVQTMVQVTREKLMQRRVLINLTLPFSAVTSAYRLTQAYEEIFGDQHIEDQGVKSFYITGNLTSASMEVLERGPLRRAVRASTSLVGIHPPLPNQDGELLIDGGIFNNTPADVMRLRVGPGTVIAVDLGFTKRRQLDFSYGEYLNGFRVLFNRVNPFSRRYPVPSIITSMMRANALASINKTEEQVSHADLILRPPVAGYGLFDLDAYDEIYRLGYEYACETIGAWIAEQNGRFQR